MGSFIGHIVPGLFFFLFGLHSTIQIFRKYFKSLLRNGKPFRCSVTYGKLRSFDLEGFMIVISAAIGIIVEIIIACIMRGMPIGMNNIQHATMYFFFGIVGVLSVLQPSLTRLLPEIENLRYLTLALAIGIEAILFKFHLFGRNEIDVLVHTLLLYTCYISVIVTLIEIKHKDNVLVTLCRAFFTILQGTWFWQTAFILYNPIPGAKEWDPEDHHHRMMVVSIFAWHVGTIFLGMIAIGIATAVVQRRKGQYPTSDMSLNSLDNGYAALLDQNEDNLE